MPPTINRYVFGGMEVEYLIFMAYNIPLNKDNLIGGPNWVRKDPYSYEMRSMILPLARWKKCQLTDERN